MASCTHTQGVVKPGVWISVIGNLINVFLLWFLMFYLDFGYPFFVCSSLLATRLRASGGGEGDETLDGCNELIMLAVRKGAGESEECGWRGRGGEWARWLHSAFQISGCRLGAYGLANLLPDRSLVVCGVFRSQARNCICLPSTSPTIPPSLQSFARFPPPPPSTSLVIRPLFSSLLEDGSVSRPSGCAWVNL